MNFIVIASRLAAKRSPASNSYAIYMPFPYKDKPIADFSVQSTNAGSPEEAIKWYKDEVLPPPPWGNTKKTLGEAWVRGWDKDKHGKWFSPWWKVNDDGSATRSLTPPPGIYIEYFDEDGSPPDFIMNVKNPVKMDIEKIKAVPKVDILRLVKDALKKIDKYETVPIGSGKDLFETQGLDERSWFLSYYAEVITVESQEKHDSETIYEGKPVFDPKKAVEAILKDAALP